MSCLPTTLMISIASWTVLGRLQVANLMSLSMDLLLRSPVLLQADQDRNVIHVVHIFILAPFARYKTGTPIPVYPAHCGTCAGWYDVA